MHAKNSRLFLIVTALVETAAGICLLFLPAVVFAVLLGSADATREAIFVGRLTGAALFAIGVASWMARTDMRSSAQLGLLTGIFFFFFNDTATTEIYTLSLHDALPIPHAGAVTELRVIHPADRVPELASGAMRDRKSTRLNSSHVAISYAVFCLKK